MHCLATVFTAYNPNITTVTIAESVAVIASEGLVLLSTWWNTYRALKIARTSNQNVSMIYLLLRDGKLLFLHLMQDIFNL